MIRVSVGVKKAIEGAGILYRQEKAKNPVTNDDTLLIIEEC